MFYVKNIHSKAENSVLSMFKLSNKEFLIDPACILYVLQAGKSGVILLYLHYPDIH